MDAGVKRVLALSSSPRRDGNSRLLADAALDGVREAGHSAELVHLDDHLGAFLRDCRLCRSADGYCTIDDGFDALFREKFLPADGVVFVTPLYWYGVSGQLKAFFDRMFCYIAASYPENEKIAGDLVGKKLALVLSSEESYTGASLGVLHEVQEYARYTHSPFVGFVQGIGNRRGDVLRDPADPTGRARELGRRLFSIRTGPLRRANAGSPTSLRSGAHHPVWRTISYTDGLRDVVHEETSREFIADSSPLVIRAS